MKRILLIGNSPLPTENTKSRPAAGLRTYQFLKPLIQEGGTVIDKADHAFSSKKRQKINICLVTIALPECYDEEPGQKEIVYSECYRHVSISKNDPSLFSTIQRAHDEFIPDAIIAVNTFSAYVASTLNSIAPLWADLNGWIMAEAQAQAEKMGSNDYLSHYYEMESVILKRADKISCVSDPQKFAVLGELSMIGRLNKETFGYKFTYSIPNGTEIFEGEKDIFQFCHSGLDPESIKKISEFWRKIPACAGMTENTGMTENAGMTENTGMTDSANGRYTAVSENANEKEKEGEGEQKWLPEDAFSLLWMGGYNTWVDELTLFNSVSDAMGKCKKLYFVSTGGQIPGLDNKTFSKFKKMVDESKFKNRFIFIGWVETADIPYIYARANAGINVDRKCTETYTGARNRINEMMKFGVPVITTLGSEISREVEKYGAGIAVRDSRFRGNDRGEGITEAICYMYNDWHDRHGYKLKEYSENGRKYVREKCNYEYLLKPLNKWLENPRPAPDRGIRVALGGGFGYENVLSKIREAFTYLKNNGIKKFFRKLSQKIKKIFSAIKNRGHRDRLS